MFTIPTASSVTSLFVTKTDFYTKKDTGEVMASVQALSPIPEGSGNGRGFEVTEYRADASILEHIDVSDQPKLYKFESQIRPVRDGFGRTTNTQILTSVILDQPRSAPEPSQPSRPQQQQQGPEKK